MPEAPDVEHASPPTTTPSAPWLPPDFVHPTRVPVAFGHHLRPIRASDVDLDMIAVMGSQPRLWQIYGRAWGWPPASMTHEQDRVDLARHEDEMERHLSFNHAMFDADETALLGASTSTRPRNPAPTPRSRGGWWTNVSGPSSKRLSTPWCRAGSPRTGP